MKLYITPGSPYARMARIVVLEKGLQSRVEIIVGAKPDVNIWGERRVEVKAPGVKVRLERADVHQKEREVIVRLGG